MNLSLLTLLATFYGAQATPPSFTLHKSTPERPVKPQRFRNGVASANSVPLSKPIVWSMDLLFGSQSQNVTVEIDTGSSDFWVFQDIFDTGKSSSFQSLGTPEKDCYGGGFCYEGYAAKDTIKFDGGDSVPNAEFFVAPDNPVNGGNGLMGLGKGNPNNFPNAVKKAGLAERASYSIWLERANNDGRFVFGGIDTTKYIGTLGKVPIYNPNAPQRIVTPLNGISVIDERGNKQDVVANMAQPVWLDSGSVTLQMKRDWINALAAVWGCQWDDAIDGPRCDYSPNQGSILFNFSGLELEVPIENIVDPAFNDGGRYNVNGKDQYWIALEQVEQAGAAHEVIFGFYFFESVYVAVDLDGNEIAMAPAASGYITSSSIVALDGNGIPSATQAPGYSNTGYNDNYDVRSATVIQSQQS